MTCRCQSVNKLRIAPTKDFRFMLSLVLTGKLRLVSSIVGTSRPSRCHFRARFCGLATDEARRGFLEGYTLMETLRWSNLCP
jgi:hypothetical protein